GHEPAPSLRHHVMILPAAPAMLAVQDGTGAVCGPTGVEGTRFPEMGRAARSIPRPEPAVRHRGLQLPRVPRRGRPPGIEHLHAKGGIGWGARGTESSWKGHLGARRPYRSGY